MKPWQLLNNSRRNDLLSLTMGSVFLTGLVSCKQEKPQKYNVLFIAFDDMNDYVSLLKDFPGIKTPNMDRFAKSSVTFSHAYCAAPKCNPSRTSLLTGIAPSNSGVYTNEDHWDQSQPALRAIVLPEVFKREGYTTLWAGKIFHDLSCPPSERLKSMWDDMAENMPGEWSGSTNLVPYDANDYRVLGIDSLSDSIYADVRNSDRASMWLSHSWDNPFFMAIGIIRPHRPWTAPKRFFDMYPIDSIKLPKYYPDDLNDLPQVGLKYANTETEGNFREIYKKGRWRETLQAYLASISFADETFGKIIDALDKSKYKDNTIVVVWADHGYHVGEKMRIGKATLWEQATHNLLMVHFPGNRASGQLCDQPVSLLDIFPTLMYYCNLRNVPQKLDGENLAPLLEKPDTTTGRVVITTWRKDCHSARDGQFRYIRYYDGGEELYDHLSDPDEWTNLATKPEYSAIKEKLAGFLPVVNVEPVGPDPAWAEWAKKRRAHKNL